MEKPLSVVRIGSFMCLLVFGRVETGHSSRHICHWPVDVNRLD